MVRVFYWSLISLWAAIGVINFVLFIYILGSLWTERKNKTNDYLWYVMQDIERRDEIR